MSVVLEPVGHVESDLTDPALAPKQGREGAPDAWLVFDPDLADAYADLQAGDSVVVLTWFHLADRDVRSVHPRDDDDMPRRGVFSTRSPSRPNPIGLHPVRVLEVDGHRVRVSDLEAVNGTPILDVKSGDVSGTPTTRPPARSRERRVADTLLRLHTDVDLWVATADVDDGRAYLIPLSFLWDEGMIWVATPASSRTGRSLATGRPVRLGLGETRDVVMIDADPDVVPATEVDHGVAERFAAHTGFDPRGETPAYLYARLVPTRVHAWRESNELAGREISLVG